MNNHVTNNIDMSWKVVYVIKKVSNHSLEDCSVGWLVGGRYKQTRM